VTLDATTVTTTATVAALMAATGPDGLGVPPPATLWRSERAAALAALANGHGSATTPPSVRSWHPPDGALTHPTDGADSRRAAEDALFTTLGRSGDGWFTRVFDRRLSRALTRRLLPLGVSPNAVTLVSISIGITGGLCFALGTPAAATVGALLFLASTIIDGCDGELARLTFRESRLGARLDLVGDNVVHVFLFGGIALGLYRRSHDPMVATLGILLVVGVGLSMAAVYACIVRRPPTPRQQALFDAFASREFAYLLVALTVIGRLDWFLWIAAIGNYVFAAGLVALGRRATSS
jgi:phosphatidylglycerophosphate synthase